MAHVPIFTITRGLPGSGKTTWARQQPGAVRVNRDELRQMLHGGPLGVGWAEVQVTVAQRAQIEALLRAGANVICDDTNLRARVARELAELGLRCGAEVVFREFTDVPLDECIRRDAERPAEVRVGEEVIRTMFQRYLSGRSLPLPVPDPTPPSPEAKYTPAPGAPNTILVDIDGTVALMNGRSPYDMSKVGRDTPHHAVIEAVRAMHAAGFLVVYCSGRSDDARADTEAWLDRHVGVPYVALHMREYGDQRKDSIVKAEIFDREVRGRYHVVAVFDDRDQVVRMWRSLGLTVFQVADGNF
jgi:predicted kinase